MKIKENPDINDTLREHGPDAARARHDGAKKYNSSTAFSAAELKTMKFDPIKYVVPGYFVEGLTLFAGKPKIGKSWLLLHAAIAVARGGFTLGDVHCPEGDVLYCALEDNKRRLHSRMTKLFGDQAWPHRLKFDLEMPRLAAGGVDFIRNWIEKAKHPRLVIIDTLAMVKTPKTKVQTQYEADYESVMELRRLANQHNVAIVLVHHLRKAEADDAFDTISGTLGLTGAPDTIMVIKRDTTGTTILYAKGRDLIEVEKAIQFNKDSCVRSGSSMARVARSRSMLPIINPVTGAASATCRRTGSTAVTSDCRSTPTLSRCAAPQTAIRRIAGRLMSSMSSSSAMPGSTRQPAMLVNPTPVSGCLRAICAASRTMTVRPIRVMSVQ
jgi:hypothetical protein